MSRPPRIDQTLSRLGYATRREAPLWAKQGRITARDGAVLKKCDVRHDIADLLVDGEPLEAPDGLYLILHKPAGLVCSHEEREGPSIYDILPERWLRRNPLPASVGRLDKDTTGLILITDDGVLNHRLTAPKHHVPKTYELTVDAKIPRSAIELFAAGTLMLEKEDKPCLPAELTITSTHTARLVLHEGRYHQVKRMMEAVDCSVTQLHRSYFGDLNLDDLAEGQWRPLREVELQSFDFRV
jgi:16S rRNA pseudouridine516 synthase